jgi:ankyrin repeat protein
MSFDRQTPLLYAAQHGNGNDTSVNLLLSTRRVNPDFQNSNGETPLWWAARNGHVAVAKLLLAEGANPETEDSTGQTPLSWAAQNGDEEMVKLLLETGANLNPALIGRHHCG